MNRQSDNFLAIGFFEFCQALAHCNSPAANGKWNGGLSS